MAAAFSDNSDLTDDEDLLPTQPIDDRVLKDVVVYVEVRSTNDNRSSAISKELQQLGARVSKKFADDVTHVVFKEGSKRTRNKAEKKGIHLVSVLWVDSCKKNQEHVSERMYPASLPDTKSTPLLITKLKKCKSMQPRDFDEDVANSAERYKKRKRRIDTLGKLRSDDNTPVSSPKMGGILVLDTQPRSPYEDDILTPVRLAIPDTPPSMKEKMRSLQKKQLDESELSRTSQDSDIDPAEQPLYRKLFDSSIYNQESSSDALDLAKLCGNSEENTPKPSPLLLNNEHLSVDSAIKTTKRSVGRRKSIATAKVSSGVLATSGSKSTRRRSLNPVSTVNSINNKEPNAVTCIGKDSTSVTHGGKISSMDECSQKNPGRKRRGSTENEDTSQLVGKKQATNRKKSSLPQSKDSSPRNLQTSKVHKRKSPESVLTRTDDAMQTKFKGRRKSMMSRTGNEVEMKESIMENFPGSLEKGSTRRRKSVTFLDVADTVGKTSAEHRRRARRKTVVGVCTSTQEVEGKNDPCLNQPQSPISATSTITSSQYTSKTLDRILMETEQIEMSMKKTKLNTFEKESAQPDDNTFPKPQSKRNNSRKKLLASNDIEPCQTLIEPDIRSQKSWSAILETSLKDDAKKQKDNNATSAKKGKKRIKSEEVDSGASSSKQTRKGLQSVQQENIPNLKSPKKKKDHGHQDGLVTSWSGTSSDDEKEDAIQKSLKDIGLSCSSFTNSSMQSTGLESKLGMSMSAVFGDDSMSLSGLCRPRPSIDEFNFRKFMPKMKKGSVAKPRGVLSESSVTSTCNDNYNTSSEDKSNSDSDTSTSQKHKKKTKENATRHKCSPNRSSIVMTSLHTHEQDVVISIVKKLRGFVISDNVSDTTTHVICGGPRRTLNLLYGLSRGCWLLHQNWVLESLDAGKWLPEEKYEITDWFPTVQITRRAKEDLKDKYKSMLFSTVGAMFVSQKTSPPRSHLISLIRMCGGQVTASSSKAQMIIGTDFYPDKMSVTPVWILDCIIQLEVLPVEKYLLGRPKRESSPEF